MIGRTLGHYEILEKLGEGGMGAVYRARDTTLGRDVALKLLPEFVAGDGERIARLEREARLLASLSHPNVATLHGLEESEGQKYLVMELVPGETLAARISRGPVRIEECLGIFRQIAEGLEAAHEKGVIHRDLKPANVVVTPEGRVKVLDFGLAKAVAEEVPSSDLSKSPTLTREGTEHGVILGTASYMSPEQARGKTLDRRTDIWSFGCVFYEALTGKKAFTGETISDILAAILEREPDWMALPAGTPVKIRELLRWCLEKDPHRRLRDIGDARIESGEPSASSITASRYTYLPWVVSAVLLGITVWSLLLLGPRHQGFVSRLTVSLPPEQALTHPNDSSVALSPDGRHVVYVAGAIERMLYIRPLDRLDARPIPGTEKAMSAFFSPDGRSVGFYRDGELAKVPIDGGLPLVVCEAGSPWGASWGPDDDILFAPDTNSGLSRVLASGGSPSVVTMPDAARGETAHAWPEILPHGKAALFTILRSASAPSVGLLSLETGRYRVLLDDGASPRYVSTGHLLFAKAGTIFAVLFDLESLELAGEPIPVVGDVWMNPDFGTAHFSVSQNGTLAYVPRFAEERSLVWVDRAGSVQPITRSLRGFEDPRLSPDGTRLAVTILEEGKLDIWTYEMRTDSFSRLSFGPGEDQTPIWHPDGMAITFRSGSPSNLFWLRSDGSSPQERLTASEFMQRPGSWSADGTVLSYWEYQPATKNDIWILRREHGTATIPFQQTVFDEVGGRFSPDGRYLAYSSDESGRQEVYVRAFPGPGGKWQISSHGGRQPVWSRNGKELFYRNGER